MSRGTMGSHSGGQEPIRGLDHFQRYQQDGKCARAWKSLVLDDLVAAH